MGVFDGLADIVFNTAGSIMGYQCTWTKADSTQITATVFYRDLSGETKLGEKKIGVDNWKIEYKDSDFPGLQDSLNGNNKEKLRVVIKDVPVDFIGISATPLSDGGNVEVKMRLKV